MLCNVRNVEISDVGLSTVSTSNPWFPRRGIALHDPLTDTVLVGSSPLAAFHTEAWQRTMTFVQSLHSELPAEAAGFFNSTHLWILFSNSDSAPTASSYALVNRHLLARGQEPTDVQLIAGTLTARVPFQPLATVGAESAVWTVISASGTCIAQVFYTGAESSGDELSTLRTVCGGVAWADTLPSQHVQWVGFVSAASGTEVLVVTWTLPAVTAAMLEWGLRVYTTPHAPPATSSVEINSTRVRLAGCLERHGCGVVSHCLLVPHAPTNGERLLCAAETSRPTANVVVLFVVNLHGGSLEGPFSSVVVPDADLVSASVADTDYHLSVFAFRGPTSAMLCRTEFSASGELSLISLLALDRVQGERPTVLAMTLNTTTRTLWLSVATSQSIQAVSVNLFAIRAVEPYVFDQHGGAVVTIQGLGFVPDPVPLCEFQPSPDTSDDSNLSMNVPSLASAPAVFVNSTTLLCISQPVAEVGSGGQCEPVNVNVWYHGRSTSTTLVGALRPLTATLLYASTAESGGQPEGWHASRTVVTIKGFGFVPAATQASCRLENGTSGDSLATWSAMALNTTTALCIQPPNAPITGPVGVLRYSHDNTTFSNAISYVVIGAYSHIRGRFPESSSSIATIVAASVVRLPSIELTSVDILGTPLGKFDVDSANRRLSCLPFHPLFPPSSLGTRFELTSNSTSSAFLTNGMAVLDAVWVVSPKRSPDGVSTSSIFCLDDVQPLRTVELGIVVSPGAPFALTLANSISTSSLSSGVTNDVVLPAVTIAVVDIVGNVITNASSHLPLQVVCTYVKASPILQAASVPAAAGTTTLVESKSIHAVATIDPIRGIYAFEGLSVRSPFGQPVQLSFNPGNASVDGTLMGAGAVATMWLVLPQRLCDNTGMFARRNTFTCVSCPSVAQCDGSSLMTIRPGYWHGSPDSLVFYACSPAESCRTALDCKAGYEGAFCGSCTEGYGRTLSTCDACTSTTAPRLIAACIVLAVVLAVWALGLRNIAFTAVEDIASRIVEAPDPTKRNPLTIIIKVVVSHLQLLSLLPLSVLQTPWAESAVGGSGSWSVITPGFLNVACAIGRRAHNEMNAVIALFGLAFGGCVLVSAAMAWLANKTFRKKALNMSIASRAKEIRSKGASPMRYRVADAMLTTSLFRRAAHRDRVLRNHRDLLQVYVGDQEREKPLKITSTPDSVSKIAEDVACKRTVQSPTSPRKGFMSWFEHDLDVDQITTEEGEFPVVQIDGSNKPGEGLPSTVVSAPSGDRMHFYFDEPVTMANYVTDDHVEGASCIPSSRAGQSAHTESSNSCTRGEDCLQGEPPLYPLFEHLVDTSALANPNLSPPHVVKRLVNLILVSLVVLAFLLYPSIVQAAQRVISCRSVVLDSSGTSVAVVSYDPAVDCNGEIYAAWQPAALWTLALVGVGFPVLCPVAVIFAQHTTCGGDSTYARQLFHFVTGGYRVWFWEAIVLSRKAAVVLSMVLVGKDEGAQQAFSICCAWIFGVSVALNVTLRPWHDASLGSLELVSLVVLCSSSLLLAAQASGAPMKSSVIAVVFIVLNVATLVHFVRGFMRALGGQAIVIIASNAPAIHDMMMDRSRTIEALRKDCRSTERAVCLAHQRYSTCLELLKFVELCIALEQQPTPQCPISFASRTIVEKKEVEDVHPGRLRIEPADSNLFTSDIVVGDITVRDLERPQQPPASGVMDPSEFAYYSLSAMFDDDIDVNTIEIDVPELHAIPSPPLRSDAWLMQTEVDLDALSPIVMLGTSSSMLHRIPSNDVRPAVARRRGHRHARVEQKVEVSIDEVRGHIREFIAWVSMLPRSVAARQADVLQLRQQHRGSNTIATDELEEQVEATFLQLIEKERHLLLDAQSLFDQKLN